MKFGASIIYGFIGSMLVGAGVFLEVTPDFLFEAARTGSSMIATGLFCLFVGVVHALKVVALYIKPLPNLEPGQIRVPGPRVNFG